MVGFNGLPMAISGTDWNWNHAILGVHRDECAIPSDADSGTLGPPCFCLGSVDCVCYSVHVVWVPDALLRDVSLIRRHALIGRDPSEHAHAMKLSLGI